jgi:hypothetical protein
MILIKDLAGSADSAAVDEEKDNGIDHEQELMRLLRADRDALEQAIEESLNTAADDHDDELSAVGGAEEEEGQEGQEDDGDGELGAQEAI